MTDTTNSQPPHQQRVLLEKQELDERIEKLSAFVDTDTFNGLNELDAHLLLLQRDQMLSLSDILAQRIARFGLASNG